MSGYFWVKMMKKTTAVYAGTFDPITYGHIDVIERATRIFDHVIIAIAANTNKKPLFSLQERVELAGTVTAQFANVVVQGFDNLLLDFANAHHATVILRGLRTVTDFDYEFQLASMNRCMNQNIETMFLVPAEKYMCISSSLVREIALLNGNVSEFVPALIVEALEKKKLTK
jgi:pantetheine-phosphate adenylyltransferase